MLYSASIWPPYRNSLFWQRRVLLYFCLQSQLQTGIWNLQSLENWKDRYSPERCTLVMLFISLWCKWCNLKMYRLCFIHVLFMFYSCFIHVLFMFYSCFIHVLFMFYSCFIHVLFMFYSAIAISLNPNHPPPPKKKPFKLQQQGLLDFDGLCTV